MAVTFIISGLLLVLADRLAGIGAYDVTWRQCKEVTDSIIEAHRFDRVAMALDSNATSLDLSFCYLTAINPGELDGLPNVSKIWLDYNNITHLHPAAFRSVPNLLWLYVRSNKLREVPVFEHLSNLTWLDLSENLITRLQATTFSTYLKLVVLNLENNLIEYLHPDLFKSLVELKVLYLNNNKVAFIPNAMFVDNKNLGELRLNGNRFSHLPYNFVTDVGLEQISFENNPWHCACLLQVLAEVKRVGVAYNNYYSDPLYKNGSRPVCVYSGAYPCYRHAPSGLLSAP